MTPARLQTIKEIFHAALDCEPNQLNAFLDETCAGDEGLRGNIEALLASHQQAENFIETPVAALAVSIAESGQADLLIGQTIGHYKISESIGTGGMGEVYLATDVRAGRKAALKLLPIRFSGDAERLKRFQQEAHAVVGLNHPNILTVYEIGEDHSIHYIASELIEGETLRQRLTGGPMQLSEAVDIAIQVASALAAAHQAGIVHRDIKPENIMLRPDAYVKVLDFGIAKLAEEELPATMPRDEALLLVETNLGSILGTVRYMSPEQACGAAVDKRTDIWSFGVVLYEMVTGHAPFTGDTPREVMTSILEKEPSPLTSYIRQAPAELQQIISKTLRKDRTERYQSAGEMLQALKNLRHQLELQGELERITTPSWLRWIRSPIALVLMLLLVLALALPLYRHRNPAASVAPDKSIAVLPLENLSEDKENAFFADGIHNELLPDLSKIADLKVISQTSVMQYKSGITRNLKEIAEQLGVNNVVEGSVGRVGNQVRVSVQLIDARTDTHLWAEHYDRDVADVFAIQTEIAQQIADQLRSKLSPAEKAVIAERPTADPVAYAYYTEAKVIDAGSYWEGADKILNREVELLEKATQRDPSFALAYCALAKAQVDLYSVTRPESLSAAHLELAKKAADAALRVRPDLGEAHLELARYYFQAGDYDRARDELVIARRTLPNDSEALFIAARIDRRQNRWDYALANFQKAKEVDPRNTEVAFWCRDTYRDMRRYNEFEQLVTEDAASGLLRDPWTQLWLAEVKFDKGDPVAAQSLLEQVPLDFSPIQVVWEIRSKAALYLRDYDAADRVIAAIPAKFADRWRDGLVAVARRDKQKAQSIFLDARKRLDARWGTEVKDALYFSQIAELDAGLGRKEEAIREARRAVDLKPIAKDSLQGPQIATTLALVYAWTGESDRALEQLEIVATIPAGPSYGDLRFNPCWDSLRGDKRFDKIVAAAKASSRYALTPLSEKSIAVLPLENLSDEKENAFFAAGIQDELLSDLSKIKDLKVISRTSVMQYKSSTKRNLKEIAQQLGVGHVVEGSVGRAGNKLRVSVQLIDARTDTHLWAEHYDRDVSDVFAIQTEIAQQIADQLQAKLSPAEKAAIAERPTADPVAYALYTEAKAIGDQ
jgi:eukaryotic-like serine/threonine-protein kinase